MPTFRLHIAPCPVAEHDHKKSKRQYAHALHRPKTICAAADFWGLPLGHLYGVLAHEIGHVLAKEAGLSSTEYQADQAIEELGILIGYVSTEKYGKDLEWLSAADRAKFEELFDLQLKDERGAFFTVPRIEAKGW